MDDGEGNKESANDGPIDDEEAEENRDCSQIGTATTSFGYRIIFTTENGTQVVYSLSGNKLINESTKQETSLSAEQQSELLNALGLVTTWKEDPE